MPPRRQARVAQPSLPSTPVDAAQVDAALPQPSRRARTRVPAGDDDDDFDLDDVSSADEDEDNEDDVPINCARNNDRATTSKAADSGVNNPDLPPPKQSSAADVHYFFKRVRDKVVCVVCR